MAYTRVNWQDYPSEDTPLTASNLNKMDSGIKAVADQVDELEDTVESLFTVSGTDLIINI